MRLPVVRSGAPLEVAELAWIATAISRETALTIPAVLACRNLIVGTVTQLGLFRYRGPDRLDPDYLLSKPDPSTTLPATIAGTVDDLIFHGRAYWHVLERDSQGFARRARWAPFLDVTPLVRSLGGSYSVITGYRVAGIRDDVPIDDLIRFDGSSPGVLVVGGRTLLSAIALEDKLSRLTATDLPAGTLQNEGAELSEDEAKKVVAGFEEARKTSGIAFLQGITYSAENASTIDADLVAQLSNVATDVARLFNVPVSMIGASPTGNAHALLYANLSQQLALLMTGAVAPYLRTIEATLSDVIPRGQSVAFDVQTFLRSDPQAAADYAIALLGAQVITTDEARGLLGIPTSAPADLTPGRV